MAKSKVLVTPRGRASYPYLFSQQKGEYGDSWCLDVIFPPDVLHKVDYYDEDEITDGPADS